MERRHSQRTQATTPNKDEPNGGRSEFDIVAIGLDVQALALAVAMRESNPSQKILFLEKKSREAWSPLSSSSSRTTDSFLHDIITMRNPRSHFTFMNYLHKTKQLVIFTNVSQIKPDRELFENYLRWVAAHFESQILFEADVTSISQSTRQDQLAAGWKMVTRQRRLGRVFNITMRKIILCMSPQPHMPAALSRLQANSTVMHAADFPRYNVKVLLHKNPQAKIAIYGKDAQAALIFLQLQAIYGKHQVTWINPAHRITATDGRQISSAVFGSNGSYDSQSLPPELRLESTTSQQEHDEATEISRQHLDQVYEKLYAQSIFEADQTKWQFRIETGHEIVAASRLADGRALLRMMSTQTHQEKEQTFDVVVSATGFAGEEDHKIMAPIRELLDHNRLTVDSDYRVNMNKHKVDHDLAMWCIGSLEPNTMSQERMTIVSERAKRVADSIRRFDEEKLKYQDNDSQSYSRSRQHARVRL